MSNKSAFFFSALDFYIAGGEKPEMALVLTTRAYAHVYHVDDGRSELARAAEAALGEIVIEGGPEANDEH